MLKRLFLLFLIPVLLSAAIGYDNTSYTAGSGNQVYTWSHTTTGTKLVMHVECGWYSGDTSLSSISYNGVSLTQLDQTSGSGNRRLAQFYMTAPATGAHNIQVTFAAPLNNAFEGFWCAAVTLKGVNQTNPIDAHSIAVIGGAAAFATFSSPTITATKSNDWLVGGWMSNNMLLFNENNGQTQAYKCNLCTSSPVVAGDLAYAGPVSVGANSLSWTIAQNDSMSNISTAITAYQPDAPVILPVKHKVVRQ